MTTAEDSTDSAREIVEIGWVIVGRMGEPDLQAALRTRDQLSAYLQRVFPEFDWRLTLVTNEEFIPELQGRTIRLLDYAGMERDVRPWDFSVVVTDVPLVGHYRPTPWAAFSTTLGAVVISTARLRAGTSPSGGSSEENLNLTSKRMEALAMHCIGHLTGLKHEDRPENGMSYYQSVEELDQSQGLTSEQLDSMRSSLREIADQRLEEQTQYQQMSSLRFYLRSAWINRRELLRAVIKAEPWLLPVRLSRVAFAAVSALLVLLMTAEAWELGMSLSGQTAFFLSVFCLFVTTSYIIVQQRLLVSRGAHEPREQRVVALISVPVIVLMGIFTTFVVLIIASLAAELMLFERSVVENWAASVTEIGLAQYLSLATFVGSVALLIGALGASLEDQQYLRHVVLVDEEI
ncbi:MAG: hypothetical protein CMJ46_14350 [Planctomyces sp.]|nr:hypothetical protein [Planctomyces sp.]